MKLVCAKCETELRPQTNGVRVIETASFGPYKIWHADLWSCPSCGFEVVAGFGQNPIAEHFESNFSAELDAAKRNKEKLFYDHEKSGGMTCQK